MKSQPNFEVRRITDRRLYAPNGVDVPDGDIFVGDTKVGELYSKGSAMSKKYSARAQYPEIQPMLDDWLPGYAEQARKDALRREIEANVLLAEKQLAERNKVREAVGLPPLKK